MANDSLRVIYRSHSHTPLWIIADKSGAWARHGLAVHYLRELEDSSYIDRLYE
jgi:hypothetical protein